jgi:ribosomal protein S12 methylthiotransferase
MYLYPDGIDNDVLSVIELNPKICRYFDMPLQHIANPMLKAMNRKMTRAEIEDVLKQIRTRIPDAVIRTQFIVGFPGETEEDFTELLEFIKAQEFDRIGCFKYSPEEGTPGGKMENQIAEEVKDERFNKLMAAAQKISRKKHRAMIGKTLEVVVEGYSEETELLLKARSSQQAPDIDGLVFINDGEAAIGEFVKVQVSASMDYDLVGSIVHECADA